MIARLTFLFLLELAFVLPTFAGDWPQFLGPTRDGVYAGNDLATIWPADGPPVVWQKEVGQGFAGPAISAKKLILFHRLEDNAVVECLDARTSESLWSFKYTTDYRDDFGFDEGPRATPCVSDGRVYVFGAEGTLHCLEFASGKKLWSVNARNVFHASKGFFGFACSPLVEGNAVLMNIGGRDNAGIVAFDKLTGKVLWKTPGDEASYSSPIVATLDGQRQALFFARKGLVSLDPADGSIRFDFPWAPKEHASVSSASPLVSGEFVFISGCYGTGAALLHIKGKEVETVWSGDDILSNHYATSVLHDGYLYGVDGRTDLQPKPNLRCVEFKTGKVKWHVDTFGAATITLAGNELLILNENGELIRAPASPQGFKPDSRAQIMPFLVRAYPALADGYLYARSKNKLVCVDLGNREKR